MKKIRINDVRQRIYDKGLRPLPKNAELLWLWCPDNWNDDITDAFDRLQTGAFSIIHATSLYSILQGDLEPFFSWEEIEAIHITEHGEDVARCENWQFPPGFVGCDDETKAVLLMPPSVDVYTKRVQRWVE